MLLLLMVQLEHVLVKFFQKEKEMAYGIHENNCMHTVYKFVFGPPKLQQMQTDYGVLLEDE